MKMESCEFKEEKNMYMKLNNEPRKITNRAKKNWWGVDIA